MKMLPLILILVMATSHASKLKYDDALSQVSFLKTPAEIDQACDAQRKRLTETVDKIVKTPAGALTFSNTVGILEAVSAQMSDELNLVTFLKYVGSDQKLRQAADKCETAVSQMFVELFVREDLYRAIKTAEKKNQKLSAEDQHLLEEYLLNFKRNGLELPADQRKKFVEKKKRLVEIEAEFSKNLVEEDEFVAFTEKEIEGVPDSFKGRLKKLSDGRYKVTLAYPDYFPFMDNAKSAESRKKLEFKFFNRGGKRNKKLLEEALRLRHETAKMLGYPNHAYYVLEKRMAKDPKAVDKFLRGLTEKLLPKGTENLAELLEAKREDLGDPKIKEVHSYDFRYYDNYLKKTKYHVDSQAVKEYFPIEKVLDGMFEIYQGLLNVRFEKVKNGPVWNQDAELYRVLSGKNTIAYFYMDLFPRDGKYGHAAAFTLVSGHLKEDGRYQTPISAIVANFSAPTKDQPSLLEHNEVETLFHEFGHIMHQVLTTAKYATFSGTSVKRDFVEAPSQMLENWVWHKEALQKLSGHYKNKNKRLPDEMIDKLLDAKMLDIGLKYLRQLVFASLDMEYHANPDSDTTAIYHRLAKDIGLLPIQNDTLPQASFGHLLGGYDAGYYGYLWSEVYAQDLFTRFEKEGLLNKKTGAAYRKWILEPGGEREPGVLIRGFLGREPNDEAFLVSLGIGKTPEPAKMKPKTKKKK